MSLAQLKAKLDSRRLYIGIQITKDDIQVSLFNQLTHQCEVTAQSRTIEAAITAAITAWDAWMAFQASKKILN